MRINNNATASSAYVNLSAANKAVTSSIEKLSSGFRINRAADDAAGLVISEQLRAQINGTKVSIRNAQDGIGLIQTADGALNEVGNILQRMRDLAVHSGTDTTDATARAADLAEYTALAEELDRIASTTKFGSQAILDGTFVSKDFVVGYSAAGGDVVSVDIESGATGEGFSSTHLGVNGLAFTNAATAQGHVATIDAAITEVATARGNLGALQNRFEHTVTNLSNVMDNLTSAESRIRDTDMAAEVTNLTKSQILSQAATAMLAQANSAPQNVLSLLR